MIDKLDLRLPSDARLTGEVRAFVFEGEFLPSARRSHRSQHYQSVTDLRPIGIDAILHKGLRRAGTAFTGSHKLEILDAGWKGFSDWNGVIERVTDSLPDALKIMRLDTCADLRNIPVAWFVGKLRVRFKRKGNNIGDSNWQTISNRSIETITAGQRPNLLRVYNKTEERAQDYRKLQRSSKGIPLTKSFEELNGFPETAIVTRVERQHTGRDVPDALAAFGDLHRGTDYNPFERVEIVDDASPDDLLRRSDLSAGQILEGIGTLFLRAKWGIQPLERWYNGKSNGNLARFKRQHAYLFGSFEGNRVKEQIIEEWRKSTLQQLAT